MALTQAQKDLILETLAKTFDYDLPLFEASMLAIKVNTEKVTLDNQIAAIRKEINAFVEQKEAEIQSLLKM